MSEDYSTLQNLHSLRVVQGIRLPIFRRDHLITDAEQVADPAPLWCNYRMWRSVGHGHAASGEPKSSFSFTLKTNLENGFVEQCVHH